MSSLAQRRRPLPVALAEFSKHLLIVGVCVALLFPMLLMVVMSLKNKEQIVFEFFTIRPPFLC